MNKTYYSEFTLNLIDEVKKREILYNTKFEKRPKPEIDGAWMEIADALDSDADKCKKHWKNVRDRFVKVMHLRNRHFFSGGTEIDAPSYVYYDKLAFMTDFSIKKYPVTPSSTDRLSMTLAVQEPQSAVDVIAPELLTYELKNSKGELEVHDLTEEFIEAVKDYPCLYDEHAELRKYRSNVAWKALETKFAGRFTVGKLRSVWIQLMKKYKYYMNSYQQFAGSIENEHIFEKLYYVPVEEKVYEKPSLPGLESEADVSYETSPIHEVEPDTGMIEIREISASPEPKKVKLQPKTPEIIRTSSVPSQVIVEPSPVIPAAPASNTQILQTAQGEDEYDLFGKKVALQLREIATKNRSVARRGEIKVLQLLMELEDSIDN